MKPKLLHIKDLDDKDRYYLCFSQGAEIIQREIQRYEYIELKEIETKHFNQNYLHHDTNNTSITDFNK